jgi:hypothetical protein
MIVAGRCWPAWLACALFALFASDAAAHGIQYEVVTTRDKQVRIGGFYAGDTAMKNARVAVRDRAGQLVFEGRTDSNGHAFFAPPGPGVYTLTIDDGAGHGARERFVLEAFQLDGTVRDLVAEGGIPRTWLEKLKTLPRWLTAVFGVSLIVNLFALFGWCRATAEARRLRKALPAEPTSS